MNKILIIVLVIITIGGGIFLSTRNNPKPIENIVQENLVNESASQGSEPESEVKQDSIINKEKTKKIMNATLHTNMGDIVIKFSEYTPNTVANFTKLAESGFYDNTKFHRVIAGFMNQGGDPLSKDDTMKSRWGTGGPGYQFADEIKPTNKNDVGTISMANAGPNTNGSQFFINVAANNFLDSKHTVFGTVTGGMDVVMKINSTPVDGSDKPLTPVLINKITLN